MSGTGTEQQTLLNALDRAECRTVEYLAELTGLSRKRVVAAAGRLIGRDFATRAEVGCFTLTEAGEKARTEGFVIKSGPKGRLTGLSRRPKRTTIRDRIWNALRIRGKASVQDLLELVGGEDGAPSVDSIQRYLRGLVRAGHLREMARRDPGTALTSNGYKRYQLLRDTGPAAPQLRDRTNTVFDPNTREVFDLSVAP